MAGAPGLIKPLFRALPLTKRARTATTAGDAADAASRKRSTAGQPWEDCAAPCDVER